METRKLWGETGNGFEVRRHCVGTGKTSFSSWLLPLNNMVSDG